MTREKAAELLNENLKNIFAFCVSNLFDKQDAEDLTNDIIVEVLSSVDKLEYDDAFFGFMWKIAENTLKKRIRKNTGASQKYGYDFYGVNWGSPEEHIVENEEIMILRRELALLSKQYRDVTVQHYLNNKSVSEISKEMKISEEMVKYYLFKTRKILKEGIQVQRNLGEKSYNPGTFGIDFWGYGNNAYVWETFDRKLPGNIVLAAYKKPRRFEELSLELGVAAPYLEDEIEILLKYNFIKQTGNKYRTNFIIFENEYENEIQQKIPAAQICKNTVKSIFETVDELLPEIKTLDLGVQLNENEYRWFLVNFVLVNALNDFDKEIQQFFGAYPHLYDKTYGIVFGHDNNYGFSFFNGIYGTADIDKTVRYDGVNYKIIERCQNYHPQNIERTRVVLDAISGKNIGYHQKETVTQLVSEDMIYVKNDVMKARFPVFSREEGDRIKLQVSELVELVKSCMQEICHRATVILKKYVPEHLKENCRYVCFLRHQSDTIGIIAEELVKIGYLKVPEERKNLCIYGVRNN